MNSRNEISRRQFLRGTLAASAPVLIAGGPGRSFAEPVKEESAKAGERPRALALIGDRYHNADYIRVALGKLFDELGLPIDFTINYAEISASLLRNYRLFVTLRDGMIWPGGYLQPTDYDYTQELENAEEWPKEEPRSWITEEQGKAIKDFVFAGNGFYALHNSSNISLYSKDFREVMGGAYLGHPPLRPFKVRVVNRDHPITKGIQDFIVNDEQHYVAYDKGAGDILLRSENLDGLGYERYGTQSIAGWAYDFGQGRVAFTAVGHTLHALWQPEYYKLQKNAVRWLLKIL